MNKNKIIFWPVLVVLMLSFLGLLYLTLQDLVGYFYPVASRAVFLDVGQGDSILLQTINRENILIDGGPDNTVIYKLGKYIPFWDREIDLLVITHPDADHITGLVEVVRRYKVKKVLATGVVHTLPAYIEFFKEISQREIKVAQPLDQKKLEFSNLELQIFWPQEDLWAQNYQPESNNTSIVIKAIFNDYSEPPNRHCQERKETEQRGNLVSLANYNIACFIVLSQQDRAFTSRNDKEENSILLTGDLGKEKELELIKLSSNDLVSDILKVGHHGSKTSTSQEFLQAVKPNKAIISSGVNNYYGHPHFRVIKNLQDKNIEILRTDELGDIEFIF